MGFSFSFTKPKDMRPKLQLWLELRGFKYSKLQLHDFAKALASAL